jgi:two-component system, cell cycle sensor histidine kinase and response regulator CckA
MSEGIISGKILLIDDEAPVLTALQKFLQKYCCEVDVCTSSSDGLRMIRNNSDQYDLLITDLTMPDLDGIALAKEVHKLRPDLPIVIMTGYGDSLQVENPESYGIRGVLSKPFKLHKLKAAIDTVLKK